MFGLNALFQAIKRLTTSVNQMADLFEASNERLAGMITVDVEVEPDALPGPTDVDKPTRRKRA